MEQFWATRTGRWRIRLQNDHEGPLSVRLYRLIRSDISEGLLPAGAIMPRAERVAVELGVDATSVADAYRALLADGLLEDRPVIGPCIASSTGSERNVGAETQVRFEKNLLDTARRASAEGVSAQDAAGIYRRPDRPKDPDGT